ncbi:PREDICTED: lethal(2)neighbour of Tid protein [Drosophila arizonae]|uniref:dolichyl-P-Man:Man5GlcNAc2-PP-dolichol alpha-1,3-mannosyltransferase n=1 Tax=Drosophila arizonae TaxID=7263 RepID=A0ABM1PLI2_DROAR|nr:PREDICTED: lethal(2)neighbour of Tid protein [Drosophila arizonae]
MASPKGQSRVDSRRKKTTNRLQKFKEKYLSWKYARYLALDPSALPIVALLIVLAEAVINVLVIQHVPYTEIDWVAYMQECEGFLNGTTNYALLRGDTGPLVYPAAFVYIYSALYYLTAHGSNVRLAQYIYIGIYLLQMCLALRLYAKSRKVPPYMLVLTAFTSYRIHSIYVLRLFNDPVAVLLLYASLNLFMDSRWLWGTIFYSLAVGVKMNILLFAPALLLFYLANLGVLLTIVHLFICGLIQVVIAYPFLRTHPVEYLTGSFDLGRIFEHKWTVNYRFLSRELFEQREFHLALLGLHLLLLLAFAKYTWTFFKSYVHLREVQQIILPQLMLKNREEKEKAKAAKKKSHHKSKSKKSQQQEQAQELEPGNKEEDEEELTAEQKSFLKSFEKGLQNATGQKRPPAPVKEPKRKPYEISFEHCTQLALLPFFLCNFIGVVCARSLHYQFYVWYFHSLPYLVWSTPYSVGVRFLILGGIEYSFNTYPSTNLSSIVLHVSHLVLLVGVARHIRHIIKLNTLVKQKRQLEQQQQLEREEERKQVQLTNDDPKITKKLQ